MLRKQQERRPETGLDVCVAMATLARARRECTYKIDWANLMLTSSE